MEYSEKRKVARIVAAAMILIPILIMFINLSVGGVLFLMGLLVAFRVIRYSRYIDEDPVNISEQKKLERHQINSSNMILLQVVDEHGYDLPRHIVDQKMKEARLHAGPKDSIMAVRTVIKRD